MWPLIRPNISAKESFERSISLVKDKSLKPRLLSIVTDIEDAEAIYITAASDANLHTIAVHNSVGTVSQEEMVSVYTGRFAKMKGPGRVIYDGLMLLPRHSKCPFCGQRRVSTLDHLLAKTTHPSLAVTPVNLVACCSDCNKTKSNLIYRNQGEQFLHPYFDNIDDDVWLTCTVIDPPHPRLNFSVTPPLTWDAIITQRAVHHFEKLKLEELYLSEAAAELESIKKQLEGILRDAGVQEVQRHLQEGHASRLASRKNSWQTALYGALSSSSWYYSGGFNEF